MDTGTLLLSDNKLDQRIHKTIKIINPPARTPTHSSFSAEGGIFGPRRTSKTWSLGDFEWLGFQKISDPKPARTKNVDGNMHAAQCTSHTLTAIWQGPTDVQLLPSRQHESLLGQRLGQGREFPYQPCFGKVVGIWWLVALAAVFLISAQHSISKNSHHAPFNILSVTGVRHVMTNAFLCRWAACSWERHGSGMVWQRPMPEDDDAGHLVGQARSWPWCLEPCLLLGGMQQPSLRVCVRWLWGPLAHCELSIRLGS